MDDNTIADILGRLARIESKIDRLKEPEPVAAYAAPMSVPPRQVPPRVDVWRESVERPNPQPATPMNSDETEFFVGAKVLPRVGAAVLAIMFVYFVSIAYDRGWIGPTTIFGSAIALCALLIGLGQRMRDEREDFGQILTGLGSCGMFLTFAGGQIYQHLYSAETMVGLFMIWSFANLAYGTWRNSKAFVGLGFTGGMSAALMPLDHVNTTAATALYAMVFIPSALMVARHQWRDMALGVWLLGLAVSSAIAYHLLNGILLIEATSVIGLALCAFVGRSRKQEIPATIPAVVTYLVALLVAGTANSSAASALHVLGFSAASLAAVWFIASKEERNELMAGALLAAITICPFGLVPLGTVVTFIALSAACAFAAQKFERRTFTFLAGLELFLAACAYAQAEFAGQLTLMSQVGVLVAAGVMAIFAGHVARKLSASAELVFLAFACGLAARLGFVGSENLIEPKFAATIAILLASVSALALGFWRSHRELRVGSLFGLMVVTGKVLLVDLSEAGPFVRVGLLFGIGLALLAGGYWYIYRSRDRKEIAVD